MAVRGINKVILVGRTGKDPEVRYIPNGGRSGKPAGDAHQKAGVTNRRGRCGSRQNGIVWCCSASSRKWQVNICARARRSTSKVSFAPVAGRITVSPVTSPKFLLRPRAPCRCWDVSQVLRLSRKRGNSSAVSLSRNHRRRPVRKKGGAKTKGRGRKATQPESQPQPPESDDYGFSDDTRSERLTVTTAPSCAGASPER